MVLGYHGGYGIFAGVGQAQGHLLESQALSPAFGPSVKLDAGSAALCSDNLHVLPADAPVAGTEGLHCGFLGGKTGRQVGRPSPAILNLARSEHPVQKALAIAFQHLADPGDFYDVDTRRKH